MDMRGVHPRCGTEAVRSGMSSISGKSTSRQTSRPWSSRSNVMSVSRGDAKAAPIGSRPAADHVEQAPHDALAIGPQAVVGVLVGHPGPQPTNATGRLLGK